MSNDAIVPHFDDEEADNLEIKLQKVPQAEACLVLVLSGLIDTYNSTNFQKRVQMAIEKGFTRLIFNCSGLNYVSSTGIGSFTAFLKAVKLKGGDLVLLDLQPKVYEVFHLLGFSQFFNIKDTLDEAINIFCGDAEPQNAGIFPKTFPCPQCAQKLKAVKPGRFRCSGCKTIIAIDKNGAFSLG